MKFRYWIALIIILWVATFLRVNDLAQIPPGLYHDEAFSGLDALSIVRGAGFPIFFEGNGGREPFFIYMHALSIWLFGLNVFALRVPAAFVGIATLPVFFVLMRALTANRKNSTAIALIGAATLATFYWHLNFSRLGWRTISLPFFACLAFYFFWRARRTGKLRDHIFTGIFLGACLYTYLADRFIPFVIAIFWLIEIVVSLRGAHLATKQSPMSTGRLLRFARNDTEQIYFDWRIYLRNAVVVVISALVVFLPLAIYYATHLDAFLFRVTDVTLASQGDAAQVILANAQRVANIFYISGDLEWRHGIAGRPILDWVTALPFAIGVLAALWRWKKAESWFAFLWLGIMLLPTILSKDAPDTQRAIGALPAVCVFIAWGAGQIAEWVAQLARQNSRTWMYAAVLVILVGSGAVSYRDYFIVWANDKHAYSDFQGNWTDLAAWINAQPGNIILPLDLYSEPTILSLTMEHFPTTRFVDDLSDAEKNQIAAEPSQVILSQNSSDEFVLLRNHTAIFLNPDANAASALRATLGQKSWVDKWNRSWVEIAPRANLNGVNVLDAPRMTTVNADFDHRLNLLGYDLPNGVIQPGQPYTVTLYWSSRAPIQQSMQVFVHLLDTDGNVVAGVDESAAETFPLGLWRVGQTMPDAHRLDIDAKTPPGKYTIEIGAYYPATGARLPIWIDGIRVADDRVLTNPVKIPQGNFSVPASTQNMNVQFGDVIEITGFSLPNGKIKPGASIPLTLLWKDIHAMDQDYTVFVHVLDASGKIVAQTDRPPQNGAYPTSIWDAGEQIRDDIMLTLPSDIPNGNYSIAIGLYEPGTGQRLPVQGSDQIILGSLQVSAD